jgi:amino acid transporter
MSNAEATPLAITQAGTPAKASQLAKAQLGLIDVLFQAITHMGPSVSVVFLFPLIANNAGAAMPVSLALAVLVGFVLANTVAEFSRYIPSSGGYYTFVGQGLGPRWGFVTAWSYFAYDPVVPAAVLGFLGFLMADVVKTSTGLDIPWWLFGAAFILITWFLTYRGVKVSTRAAVILGALELLIIFALGITFLVHPAQGSSLVAPINPASSPNGIVGILFGVAFSITALSGFESAAPLAEETRRPHVFISRAIMLSIAIVGVFFVFMSYASAIGWGTSNMAAFATNPNPFYDLAHKLWGPAWFLVFLALLNGAMAIGIAATNASTRVMYTMARGDALPGALSSIHPKYRTPSNALHFQTAISLILMAIVGIWLGGSMVFGFLGTIITVGLIVMYGMSNLGLVAYMRRYQPNNFNVLRHGVVPILGTLLLLPVLWVTFWPVPAFPFNIVPYVFIAWLVVGLVVMKLIESRDPNALSRAAALLATTPEEKF